MFGGAAAQRISKLAPVLRSVTRVSSTSSGGKEKFTFSGVSVGAASSSRWVIGVFHSGNTLYSHALDAQFLLNSVSTNWAARGNYGYGVLQDSSWGVFAAHIPSGTTINVEVSGAEISIGAASGFLALYTVNSVDALNVTGELLTTETTKQLGHLYNCAVLGSLHAWRSDSTDWGTLTITNLSTDYTSDDLDGTVNEYYDRITFCSLGGVAFNSIGIGGRNNGSAISPEQDIVLAVIR